MEIRVLVQTDDRSTFESGDLSLDRFFRQFAGQNQFKHYLGTTYVAIEQGVIIGFVTVAVGHIDIENLPPARRKKLSEYPLPILRLARMAVQENLQRGGVGRRLLRYTVELALYLKEVAGCTGVVVDAKPGSVAYYERYGFEAMNVLEGESAARPLPTPMYLSIRDIAAAIGSS